MSELVDILNSIDDDYLVGISNKGILKRAYKDKEEVNAEILKIEADSAEIKTGEETVQIKVPLAESTCSCPSRSICRHVIMGILVLGEQLKGGIQSESDIDKKDIEKNNIDKKDIDKNDTDVTKKDTGEILCDKKDAEKNDNENTAPNESESLITKIQEELAKYPLENVRKLMKAKKFEKVLALIKSGKTANITETSIVTVELPDGEHRIKLVSPLEYSTCTCHKTEFCEHKAEAVFWYKHQKGMLQSDELTEELGKSKAFKTEEIHAVAEELLVFIKDVINTGLSRASYDILDTIDRMALLCHNAELANYESYLRSLRDSFDAYLKRKSSFKTEVMMNEIMRLYRRTQKLCNTKSNTEILQLAGTFRNEYNLKGDLELINVSVNHFSNKSGYEGETYYFLENNTNMWYSYTIARPVFYENKRRVAKPEMAAAPWGLNISMNDMYNMHLILRGAKCDDRMRLSASQDTKGEALGKAMISKELVAKWHYIDFRLMFEEQLKNANRKWLADKSETEAREAELVLVQPMSFDKAEFDKNEQRLKMRLQDINGDELWVEVQYSKEEKEGIRYLENLKPDKNLCFLGKLYIREGRMCLYPITVIKLCDEADLLADYKAENTSEIGENDGKLAENRNKDEKKYIIEYVQTLLGDILVLLADIYQSGFQTVSESIIGELKTKADKLKDIEMTLMSEKLAIMSEKLDLQRHLFDEKKQNNMSEILDLYADMVEYIYVGLKKTDCDLIEL